MSDRTPHRCDKCRHYYIPDPYDETITDADFRGPHCTLPNGDSLFNDLNFPVDPEAIPSCPEFQFGRPQGLPQKDHGLFPEEFYEGVETRQEKRKVRVLVPDVDTVNVCLVCGRRTDAEVDVCDRCREGGGKRCEMCGRELSDPRQDLCAACSDKVLAPEEVRQALRDTGRILLFFKDSVGERKKLQVGVPLTWNWQKVAGLIAREWNLWGDQGNLSIRLTNERTETVYRQGSELVSSADAMEGDVVAVAVLADGD